MDIPDIQLVVQYKATCNLCTLWQRFGRGARGPEWDATAILLVEKKNTEEDRLLKAKRAAERKGKNKEGIRTGKKRKPTDNLPLPPSKRPALAEIRTRPVNQDLGMMTVEPSASAPMEVDEAAPVPGNSNNVGPTTQETLAREAEWLNECRLDYQKGREKHATNLHVQKKGQEKDMVAGPGTPMYDFINAYLHVRCLRKVINLYFGNDTDRRKGELSILTSDNIASHACQFTTAPHDHTLCNSSTPNGCLRCAPSPPSLCCNLCNPEYFKKFNVVSSLPAMNLNPPRKSHIKPFEMTPTCKELRHALFDWRKGHAMAMFGESVVERLGAKLLLPDESIDRLVACSQAFKITTVSDITKETGWTNEDNWVEKLGESLLAILHKHFPLPLPLPLPEILVTTENGTLLAKQKRSCSACGATDHIRKSYTFIS
jgi:hypothetical protein